MFIRFPRRAIFSFALMTSSAAMWPAPVLAAGDAAKGKAAYAQRCASCHSLEYNGAGPAHRGLLGRKAGTVADFTYSPALRNSGVTWSGESLEQWLSDPEKFIPGQKMWISVPDAVERQDIIAYLRAEAGK